MSDDLKTNMEILSKIVIQLKSEQKDLMKNLKAEIEEIKVANNLSKQKTEEIHEKQIQNLSSEISNLKNEMKKIEEKNSEFLTIIESKLEKTDKDLRDDMLKLLKKYESKFQTQDDEIENLKEKCEMAKCAFCDFESFLVHFKLCPKCNENVCMSCLKNCKKCDDVKCAKCLCECNTCLDLFCNNYIETNQINANHNGELNIDSKDYNKNLCLLNCKLCKGFFCEKCNFACSACNNATCKLCLQECRLCKKQICKSCCKQCEKCFKPIICNCCYEKNSEAEKCICGKTLCFQCEDECSDCNIPFTFLSNTRIFTGFHTRSQDFLPNKCLIKMLVVNKGIDTTHIGLTVDAEFLKEEKATENFWSLCLNTGEKFSTLEYKKKGIPWANYSIPVKTGDYIYLRFYEGEVRFLINRKDFGRSFLLDVKNHKYFLYCLTHNDSTKIEIRSMKILNNLHFTEK